MKRLKSGKIGGDGILVEGRDERVEEVDVVLENAKVQSPDLDVAGLDERREGEEELVGGGIQKVVKVVVVLLEQEGGEGDGGDEERRRSDGSSSWEGSEVVLLEFP